MVYCLIDVAMVSAGFLDRVFGTWEEVSVRAQANARIGEQAVHLVGDKGGLGLGDLDLVLKQGESDSDGEFDGEDWP